MAKLRVLLDDGLAPVVQELFRKAQIELDVFKPTFSGVAQFVRQKNYDALVVQEGTRISTDVLDAGRKTLKAIGVVGDSLNNLDLSDASKRGILVKITEYGNTYEAANLAIRLLTYMLSESFQERKSGQALIFTDIKSILPESPTGYELSDKVVGLIGCGRVAQALAVELQAHCRTILGYDEDPRTVYDRFHSRDPLVRSRIEYCTVNELLERADVITVHTSGPQKVFRGRQLQYAKRKPYIVDTARDGTIDERSLLSALKTDKIRGAAITVPQKQLAKGGYPDFVKRFISFSNVVVAPTLGRPTVVAHKKNSKVLVQAVIDFLLSGSLELAVNPYVVVGGENSVDYPLSVQGRRGVVPYWPSG